MRYQILFLSALVVAVVCAQGLDHNVASASSILVMNGYSNQTTAIYLNGSRQVQGETGNSTSVLANQYIDSITMQLSKTGSPAGTAYIGVLNPTSPPTMKKQFGTIDVSSLTPSMVDHVFTLNPSTPYKIQAGDRIGIWFTGGDSNDYVNPMMDSSNLFDGTNSAQTSYATDWAVNPSWDAYMVLTVTQPTLTATAVSPNQINLSWSAPLNATSFQIERESPVGGGFSVIVPDTGSSSTTYSDTSVAPDTQYNYRVTMRDSGGLTNIVSQSSAATTQQAAPVTQYFTNFFQIVDSNLNKAGLYINSLGKVGIDTNNPQSTLDVNGTVHLTGLSVNQVTKASAYTLAPTDDTVLGDSTGGAFTFTLPSASGLTGKIFEIKKADSSPNAITVSTTPGQTIDGATSLALSHQNDFVVLESDGKNWNILAGNMFAGNVNVGGSLVNTQSSGTFKITAPPGVNICIGTGC